MVKSLMLFFVALLAICVLSNIIYESNEQLAGWDVTYYDKCDNGRHSCKCENGKPGTCVRGPKDGNDAIYCNCDIITCDSSLCQPLD